MTRLLLNLISPLLFLFPILSRCYAAPLMDWKDAILTSSSPGQMEGHTMIVVERTQPNQTEYGLLFGGQYDRFYMSNDVYRIDRMVNNKQVKYQWSNVTTTGIKPAPRYQAGTTYLRSTRRLYACGGSSDDLLALGDCFTLDVDTLIWKELITTTEQYKPTPRWGVTMTSVSDSKFLLFGGYDGYSWFSDVILYDASSNAWSRPQLSGSPPSARAWHSATWIPSHQSIVVFGGQGSLGTATYPHGFSRYNDIYYMSPADSSWSRVITTFPQVIGTSPMPRDNHAALAYGDSILVFGGLTTTETHPFKGRIMLNDVNVFNLRNNTWTTSISFTSGTQPVGRMSHSMIRLGTDTLIYAGMDAFFYN